jgi:hypothetical protein
MKNLPRIPPDYKLKTSLYPTRLHAFDRLRLARAGELRVNASRALARNADEHARVTAAARRRAA